MTRRNAANPVSAVLTSLPLEFGPAVREAARLGFTHVDVIGLVERPAEHLDALAEAGTQVSCVAIGRDLPAGHTLDAADVGLRRAALEAMKRQVTDAARLGASSCYVVPGTDATAAAMARFAESCCLLADFAGQRMLQLCVEPTPGRALPSAAVTLEWLGQAGHEGLSLLLDVGHCLISGEDPALVIEAAGRRLGYVHFDDNDGEGDLHWPLLEGRLTPDLLGRTLSALRTIHYDGALALELRPDSADPAAALRAGKELLERLSESR